MPCTVTAQSQYWIGFLHAKRVQANKEILIIYLHLLTSESANDVSVRFYDNCAHLWYQSYMLKQMQNGCILLENLKL